ncbi:MAG: hypothetical protein IJR99_00620 [Kiritimatiellae bacterium]|nr:hypothetical protein [Kiritimatiellia bacterium]
MNRFLFTVVYCSLSGLFGACFAATLCEWPDESPAPAFRVVPGPDTQLALIDGYAAGVKGIRLRGGIGQRSFLRFPDLGARCDLTNSFTVEGWFQKAGDPEPGHSWALAGPRDDANGWTLELARTDEKKCVFSLFASDVQQGGKLQFESFFPNANLCGDTNWHHVALCYTHDRKNGIWSLLLDGIWQGDLSNPSRPDRSHGFRDLVIGGRPSFSASFHGKISRWRVSDCVLTYDSLLCEKAPFEPPSIRMRPPKDTRSIDELHTTMRSSPLPAAPQDPRWREAFAGVSNVTWAAPFITWFNRTYVFWTTGTNRCDYTCRDKGGNWETNVLHLALPGNLRGDGHPFLADGKLFLAFTSNVLFTSASVLSERNSRRVSFQQESANRYGEFFRPDFFHLTNGVVLRFFGDNPLYSVYGTRVENSDNVKWKTPQIAFYDFILPEQVIQVQSVAEHDGKNWAWIDGLWFPLPHVRSPYALWQREWKPGDGETCPLHELFGCGYTRFVLDLHVSLDQTEDGEFLFNTDNGRRGIRVRKDTFHGKNILRLDLLSGMKPSFSYRTPENALPSHKEHRVTFECDPLALALTVSINGQFAESVPLPHVYYRAHCIGKPESRISPSVTGLTLQILLVPSRTPFGISVP